MAEYESIAKYDRLRGNLHELGPLCLFTKPSTIKSVQNLTGKSETFVVETGRHHELGDYIFIECIDEAGAVTRLALPPKVSDAIASQRESLTARRRSQAAKRLAAERKARGEVPGFMKNPGKRKKKA